MAGIAELYQVASALRDDRDRADVGRNAFKSFGDGLGQSIQDQINPSMQHLLAKAELETEQQKAKNTAIQTEMMRNYLRKQGVNVDQYMPMEASKQQLAERKPHQEINTNAGAAAAIIDGDAVMTSRGEVSGTRVPSKFIDQTTMSMGPGGVRMNQGQQANPDYANWVRLQNEVAKAGGRITGQESPLELQNMLVDLQESAPPTIEEQKFALSKNKAEKEDAEKQRKFIAAQDAAKQETADMLDIVGSLKKHYKKAGGNQIIPDWAVMPGGDRATFEVDFKRFQAKNILSVMSKLKELSPTGSTGFGALSEKEMSVLQSAATSLDPNLPDELFLERLLKVEELLNKAMSGFEAPEGNPEESSSFDMIDEETGGVGGRSIDVGIESAVGNSGVSKEDAIAELRRRGVI